MESVATMIKERDKARKEVEDLHQESRKVYFIHYSCESFDKDSSTGSVKVAQISIGRLLDGQTQSWSILKSAELQGCLDTIPENFNRLEKMMLDGFFQFLSKHDDCYFVHWNMRNDHYGFPALEHRHRALGGVPCVVRDAQKIDLSRLLWRLYGDHYANHTSKSGKPGRLFRLIELNSIGDKGALPGEAEPKAFEAGDYLKVQESTLRKLEIFNCIFELARRKKLKTDTSWLDTSRLHPLLILDTIKRHWLVTLILFGTSLITALIKLRGWIEPFYSNTNS